MNVLLIYPHWPETYWSFRHALKFQGKRAAYPPLGLLTVVSMLPDHWHRRLVDSSVRRLTDADLKWANIAMLSGMLVHKAELIEILERCRRAGLRSRGRAKQFEWLTVSVARSVRRDLPYTVVDPQSQAASHADHFIGSC